MCVPNGVSAEYRNESLVGFFFLLLLLFALKQEPQNSRRLELLNLRLERLSFVSLFFFSLSLFLNVFGFTLCSPLGRFFRAACVCPGTGRVKPLGRDGAAARPATSAKPAGGK